MGATSVGPAGGKVLGMLALAARAWAPAETLRRMTFVYPAFHGARLQTLHKLSKFAD